MDEILHLAGNLPIQAQTVGIMISRGQGRHIERIASYYVLLFVHQGVVHIEENGRSFELHEGDSLLLWPDRLHRGTQDFDDNVQFFWMHFTVTSPQQEQEVLKIPQYAKVNRPDFVTELFRRYMDDENSGCLTPLRASLYAWMILVEIAEVHPVLDTRASALAGSAMTYIRTNFHKKISASHVAEAIGYSPQYLGRIFQQNYNQSVAEAIRRIRINHSKRLLLHSNSSASEIARQCGFKNATYYQRVFKELEGITPLQFRRLHARMSVNTH